MNRLCSQTWLAPLTACFAAAASAAGPAPSAVLKQIEGRVFVAQAKTMGLAVEGASVYQGSRVVAVTGASARVIYPDGCSVALLENSLLVVGGPDQCRAGRAMLRETTGFQEQAIGAVIDSSVASLLDRFDSLDPEPLVGAYDTLSAAERTQLVGALNDSQLTRLYIAIGKVQSKQAAESFLALLNTAQAKAVVAGAGAAGTTGITIGALTLTGAEVAALGLATIAVGALIYDSTNDSSNDNRAASQ